ncbi:MAG: SusC/RagA family TonB-linked outer membrane protein [Paludibacter sp.]|nr:SusC/RagA family TonB-linked outer membrane protein [Paludibacter sp.]
MKNQIYIIISVMLLYYGMSLHAQISAIKNNWNESDTIINKGFGLTTTVKESTMSSATAHFSQMKNFSAMNPENSLYGLIPGLTVLTNGGPSYNNAPVIQLRGLATLNSSAPLVLVDGVERPLSRLSVAEIETVTVLKDAAAVAIYGIRGANGVILVTTKRGEQGKMKVDITYQHGITTPFRLPRMVDAPTYATALNEALTNDGLASQYTKEEIQMFSDGSNPDIYPNVNWLSETTRNTGSMNELNIGFSGGSESVRYFSDINYANDFGLLNPVPSLEGYNTSLNYYKLNVRTNLDAKLTPTTWMKVNVMGSIDDYTRPNVAPATLFQRAIGIPAAAFPVKTTSGEWGGNPIYTTWNPVAGIASTGFVRSQNRILFVDLNLKQDLNAVFPGLKAEAGISYDNMAEYLDTQSRTFRYESAGVLYGNNSDLNFSTTLNDMYMNSALFGRLDHQMHLEENVIRTFLLYSHEQAQHKTRNNLVARRNYVAGVNFTRSERYFVDLIASYSGSSYLPKGDKFRFYPAISTAWLISGEDFMKSKTSSVDLLKLRASFGLSGNDLMSYELDRQYIVSGTSYFFNATSVSYSSLKEGQLANTDLTAELAKKANVGIDLTLSGTLNFSLDAFYEKRSGILVPNNAVISSVLGIMPALTNMGVVSNKGFEGVLSYDKTIGDLKYGMSAQFSFVRNKILENNEGYKPYDYLYKTGNPIGTYYGLEADGFFDDMTDIAASYPQLFSTVAPGDIKYLDQNDDYIIDGYDVVKLGYSTLYPEIYYSFSLRAEYKGLGFDALFQGVDHVTVIRNAKDLYWPLTNNGNISDWYYNGGRWTETTKETAVLPRLTTLGNENNFRNNSVWMENGAYLKLRYLDLYYNLPKQNLKIFHAAKIYVRAVNLFALDHVKDKDPEVMSTGYPSLSAYYIGCSVSF